MLMVVCGCNMGWWLLRFELPLIECGGILGVGGQGRAGGRRAGRFDQRTGKRAAWENLVPRGSVTAAASRDCGRGVRPSEEWREEGGR